MNQMTVVSTPDDALKAKSAAPSKKSKKSKPKAVADDKPVENEDLQQKAAAELQNEAEPASEGESPVSGLWKDTM